MMSVDRRKNLLQILIGKLLFTLQNRLGDDLFIQYIFIQYAFLPEEIQGQGFFEGLQIFRYKSNDILIG